MHVFHGQTGAEGAGVWNDERDNLAVQHALLARGSKAGVKAAVRPRVRADHPKQYEQRQKIH